LLRLWPISNGFGAFSSRQVPRVGLISSQVGVIVASLKQTGWEEFHGRRKEAERTAEAVDAVA
jgi:hypothetical protein